MMMTRLEWQARVANQLIAEIGMPVDHALIDASDMADTYAALYPDSFHAPEVFAIGYVTGLDHAIDDVAEV